MTDDPRLDAVAFDAVMRQAGVPVDLETAWRLSPVERGWCLRQHRRRLLTMTPPGRRRLRQWLDRQQGRPIETRAARRLRVADALFFVGDPELFAVVVNTIASLLPPPVVDAVLDEAVVVVSGRSSNGWIAGSMPCGRRVVSLAGHRSDNELASTLLHEIGHLWSQDQADASSEQHRARAVAEMVDRMAATADRPTADRFVRGQWLVVERQANALRIAWEPA